MILDGTTRGRDGDGEEEEDDDEEYREEVFHVDNELMSFLSVHFWHGDGSPFTGADQTKTHTAESQAHGDRFQPLAAY